MFWRGIARLLEAMIDQQPRSTDFKKGDLGRRAIGLVPKRFGTRSQPAIYPSIRVRRAFLVPGTPDSENQNAVGEANPLLPTKTLLLPVGLQPLPESLLSQHRSYKSESSTQQGQRRWLGNRARCIGEPETCRAILG